MIDLGQIDPVLDEVLLPRRRARPCRQGSRSEHREERALERGEGQRKFDLEPARHDGDRAMRLMLHGMWGSQRVHLPVVEAPIQDHDVTPLDRSGISITPQGVLPVLQLLACDADLEDGQLQTLR